MKKVQVRKQNKLESVDDLNSYTKEELIEKVKALQSHNAQLKNLIAKTAQGDALIQDKKQKPFDFNKCCFRKVLLKFFYLGWDYQGFASQEDTINTIEYHLFKALKKTCFIKDRESSNYHRCGRTDKGVSSFGQVISINLRSKLKPEHFNEIDKEFNYCKVLNRVLPDEIQCVAWCPINEEFSARFDCLSRTYKYFFPLGKLNLEKMRKACSYLIGTHDFRNLCKMDVGNGVVEFIRNILKVDIEPFHSELNFKNEYTMYILTIQGQAFLWHQIRCIMGILFLIGQNREEPELIKELLDVESNQRKPDYNMASEIPLNLYLCEYEGSVSWIHDADTLNNVICKLKQLWTFNSIKSAMNRCMIEDLQKEYNKLPNHSDESKCTSEFLINGIRCKQYTPVMKRQKCDSLEDKIKHYLKRKRLEVLEEPVL